MSWDLYYHKDLNLNSWKLLKGATQANISAPQQCGGHNSLYFNWNIANRGADTYPSFWTIQQCLPLSRGFLRKSPNQATTNSEAGF
jgi:hypothetical protein